MKVGETAEEFMALPWMDAPGLIKEIRIDQLIRSLELCVESGWAEYVISDPCSKEYGASGPYEARGMAQALKEELFS